MNAVLDSRQLAAFAAVARLQSFTQAAQELFVTQSAISHAIKALEEEVGNKLVERTGRRVFLTTAGELFLKHTQKILTEMDAARSSIDTLARWGQSRLRVGASTTACQYILPTVLREFKQSFPRCALTIETGDHSRQMELLATNQIDLAITLESKGSRELKFVPLFEDELRFHVSPMHPWAKRARVSSDEVQAETLVLYNKASFTFNLVTDYLRRERITVGHVIELGSMDAIKSLVKIGVGVGVLAPWIASEELESGALYSIPIGKKRLRRRWSVAHLKGRKLSLGEETFVGLCQSVTTEFARVGGAAA